MLRALVVLVCFVLDMFVWGGQNDLLTGGTIPVVVVVVVVALAYFVLAVVPSVVPGFVAMWLVAAFGAVVPALECYFGYLVAIFLVARRENKIRAWCALLASIVPVVGSVISTRPLIAQDADDIVASYGVLSAAFIVTSWGAGRMLARNEQRLVTERRWATDARAEAITAERLRISRELHDSVAHSLTGIVLQAAGAKAGLRRGSASTEQLDTALDSIQGASEQSIREMHRLVGLLREDQAPDGGVDGIDEIPGLVDSSRATGVDVTISTTGDPVPVDPSIGHTAYRVVQEGLSNAMRHGGTGVCAEIEVRWEPGRLTILVRSTTGLHVGTTEGEVDISLPSGGFGIAGLRERVAVLGGSLDAGPTDGGYLLRATMPLGELPAARVVATSKEG